MKKNLFLQVLVGWMMQSGCTNNPIEPNPPLQGEIAWDKSYGGSSWDDLRTIAVAKDGGYLLGGKSASSISGDRTTAGFGGEDYWVIKIDVNGNRLWDKTLGGSRSDELTCILATKDGGFLIGGNSQSGPSGNKTSGYDDRLDMNYWVIKLNASGDKLWEKTYGDISGDFLNTMVETKGGGYLLGGWTNLPESGKLKGGSDYWIVKTDAQGDKIWDKSFGGDDSETLRSIVVTADNSFLLGGSSSSGISGDKSESSDLGGDFWVIKITSDGNKVWDKTYASPRNQSLMGITTATDGGFLLGGLTNVFVSDALGTLVNRFFDYWVVKIDEQGNKEWDKRFGGDQNDYQLCTPISYPGGFLLGGYSFSGISGNKTSGTQGPVPAEDFWVINIDSKGEKVWERSFGSEGNTDAMRGMVPASDGGYILAGESVSPKSETKTAENKGGSDFWLVKIK